MNAKGGGTKNKKNCIYAQTTMWTMKKSCRSARCWHKREALKKNLWRYYCNGLGGKQRASLDRFEEWATREFVKWRRAKEKCVTHFSRNSSLISSNAISSLLVVETVHRRSGGKGKRGRDGSNQKMGKNSHPTRTY